ncbi:MAG TPA: ribonuclease HII [Soehngenia sp.]|mgnify:CR=1 FL=1|nr:ribonuclease HII [Soehngenia sp.]HPP30843.1 ribonuclease HII [Soehngenia sp.]
MNEIELELYKKGYDYIFGVDEVGRGSLFGDVTACAIILPKYFHILDVKDSKKLSSKKREYLNDIIMSYCIDYSICCIDNKTIDEINIKQATKLAMKDAITNLLQKNKISTDKIIAIVDAERLDLPIDQISLNHADDLIHHVSCASIVAKVYRDNLCNEWDKLYPQYKLYKNKGYGTAEHIELIRKYGVSDMHRKSFLNNILRTKKYE